MKNRRVTTLCLLLLSASIALYAEEDDPLPLSRLPIPLQLTPDMPESASATISNPPAAPLTPAERGELSARRLQILDARDQFRDAFRDNPNDPLLREDYAWFLYSNGFHDKECLRLLEVSLRDSVGNNPADLFNAIVEVRGELHLPETPLRQPEAVSKKTKPRSTGIQDSHTGKSFLKPIKTISEADSDKNFRRWILTPYYSYSSFNHGRQPWQEEYAQLLYRLNERLILGGEVDVLERPPSGANIYYSALASWYLLKTLEIHGKISICPSPTFAATQIYSGGTVWQATRYLGILADYQRYNFLAGPIDQINPGIVWSLNESTWLTLRYVRGWAFYNLEYNYYSAAFTTNLPGNRKITASFAYGTDPDSEIGANGNNVTSLSPAYTYSLFITQPLTRDLSLFAGIQYCYRLQSYGGGELYEQITPTIGCSLQF